MKKQSRCRIFSGCATVQPMVKVEGYELILAAASTRNSDPCFYSA